MRLIPVRFPFGEPPPPPPASLVSRLTMFELKINSCVNGNYTIRQFYHTLLIGYELKKVFKLTGLTSLWVDFEKLSSVYHCFFVAMFVCLI